MLSIASLLLFISLVHCLSPKDQFAATYPRIVGYWGANPGGHSSTVPQLKTALQKGYNVIIYAFYDVDSSGGFNVDPGSAPAPKKSDLGSGFIYLISLFGGQNGSGPSVSDPNSWARAMYSSFQNLRSSLGLDGIDIDLENAWGPTPTNIECGLRAFFKLMHAGGFVVSMAPQTTAITPQVSVYEPGSWNSYAPLADTSIASSVDIVAVQLYNNAVPFNDAAKYLNSLSSSGFQVSDCPCSASCNVKLNSTKIAFGYPATQGAAPSGCPGYPGGCPYGSGLTNMYNSNAALLSTGGVMTWSIEWDESGGWAFVNAARGINFKKP